MLTLLFNKQKSGKAYEKDTSSGALGDIPVFGGTITYDQANQGYDRRYEFEERAGGMQVERKLYDDDLLNVMNRMPKELGYAVAVTHEKIGAKIFNEAFTTEPSGLGGPLNSSAAATELCASDQYDSGYGTDQSNEGTTALSAVAVEATRILMAKFKGDRGQALTVHGNGILAPIDLQETAWEIINSKGKVDTSDNNANFHEGKYKLYIWPNFLSDTNNWFMLDTVLIADMLFWWERVAPEFFQDKDSSTLLAKYCVYMRQCEEGLWRDWRFVYGHLVS